jgi:hypothetical protein
MYHSNVCWIADHALYYCSLQVKVWFQNRRTKYKRDRSRDNETADSKSESVAACNILRLLQNQIPRPNCTNYLPPYPYAFSGYSAS